MKDLGSLLAELRPLLIARARLRTRADDVDDLVQETLADVLQWSSRTPAWTPEDVTKVAHTVLRRRLIDSYRRERATEPLRDQLVSRPETDQRLALEKLGRVVERHRQRLTVEARALLDRAVDEESAHPATGAERKQLQRLRASLRAAVENDLGGTIREFLGDDEEGR